MKRTEHTAKQIICKLKTSEQLIAQSKTIVDGCDVIELMQPLYHCWSSNTAACRPMEPGGRLSWERRKPGSKCCWRWRS
ncbi:MULTISPECIES: hypothetical protein [Aphanothece]|uniref:hypothetical protein n=1 Tax=Aphanothece TaxID=1121 RepID=UPI00398F2853